MAMEDCTDMPVHWPILSLPVILRPATLELHAGFWVWLVGTVSPPPRLVGVRENARRSFGRSVGKYGRELEKLSL